MRRTLADTKPLANSIHGVGVAIRGEHGQAIFLCPLLPYMVWGAERHTPTRTDMLAPS